MKLKNIQQMIILFLGAIVLILSGILYFYKIQSEEEKQKIDEYNFEQLEKAKVILDQIPKDTNKFHTLKSFNEIYDAGIEPIKNCYYVSNVNGEYPYIFGFRLESKKYIKQYGNKYYAYPKYDLPYRHFCDGGPDCRMDYNLHVFLNTISSSCTE